MINFFDAQLLVGAEKRQCSLFAVVGVSQHPPEVEHQKVDHSKTLGFSYGKIVYFFWGYLRQEHKASNSKNQNFMFQTSTNVIQKKVQILILFHLNVLNQARHFATSISLHRQNFRISHLARLSPFNWWKIFLRDIFGEKFTF